MKISSFLDINAKNLHFDKVIGIKVDILVFNLNFDQ